MLVIIDSFHDIPSPSYWQLWCGAGVTLLKLEPNRSGYLGMWQLIAIACYDNGRERRNREHKNARPAPGALWGIRG